jgi:BirA family biotin operon repressor/biotin-[acetyl-CoA-carboxylase] ligase
MHSSPDQRLPNGLSEDAIKRHLKTRWLGRESIYFFNVVESTNTEANRIARDGAPEGTLILADAQSKGRGRLRRSWVSPPGAGLYLSIILRPTCPADRLPGLTLTAGVAAASAIQHTGVVPQLKWPNDILISGRKVGGILTEAVFDKKQLDFAVLGIGINVDTARDEFPVSVRNLATSLRLSLGEPVSRIDLLQTLLKRFEHWYAFFCSGAFEGILEAWSLLDITLGNAVEVSLPGRRLLGVAEALTPDGALLVRDKTNRLHTIIAGDIVHCRVDSLSVVRSPLSE